MIRTPLNGAEGEDMEARTARRGILAALAHPIPHRCRPLGCGSASRFPPRGLPARSRGCFFEDVSPCKLGGMAPLKDVMDLSEKLLWFIFSSR